MKQFSLLAIITTVLSIVVQPALAERQAPLRWAGCGISKKAYMVALAEAYEEKTGIKIDLEGGGDTRNS